MLRSPLSGSIAYSRNWSYDCTFRAIVAALCLDHQKAREFTSKNAENLNGYTLTNPYVGSDTQEGNTRSPQIARVREIPIRLAKASQGHKGSDPEPP
jgi:hypothetical protein